MTANKMLTNQWNGFDSGKFSRVKDPPHAAESAGKKFDCDRFFSESTCNFSYGEIKKNLKLDLFLFNFRYAGRLKAKKREMVVESDFHHKEKVLNHKLSQINFFTRGDL